MKNRSHTLVKNIRELNLKQLRVENALLHLSKNKLEESFKNKIESFKR